MKAQGTLPFLIIAILLSLAVLPLFMMFFHTIYTPEGFSITAYKAMFHNPSLWHSFQNSFILASFVSIVSTFVGILLGVLLGKTNLRFRFGLLMILLIPLLIPPYILAYSWFTLLGNSTFLFGFWGTSFILFCIYLPIPILLTILFLKQIDPKMEEAALLHTTWFTVLKHITLPLISPAILFSFLLLFMLSFGEFSVANFLRYPIFPMESFTQFSAFYDFKLATVTAMPMLFIGFLVIALQKFTTGKSLRFLAARDMVKIDLKEKEKLFLGLVLLFVTITVLLPLLSLFMQVDIKSFILAFQKATAPLSRSILFATLSATSLLFFGFLSAYLVEQKHQSATLFSTLTLFLFILPSTLIGIALILFYNTPYTNFIYATPLIILFAYTIKYLFLSSKIIENKLIQIPYSLIESAKLSGASWRQIIWFIVLPLAKDALIVAWLVGFIFSLRESTLTMLVYPAGADTLPLYIFTQMANGDPKVIASLCLIMIFLVILPLGTYFTLKRVRT
jgi:iron(III) transport system permease protein